MPSSPREVTLSSPAARPGVFTSPQRQVAVLSLLLVMGTLLLYQQTSHFSFVNFDDDFYVTNNPYVQAGLHWSTVSWALRSNELNWHPLTWLSHALDCQIFGLNPAGPHLVNLFLHALNSVLLFLLLVRGTKRVGASFFVAALFAFHPLNVESVAWVSERKNVLSTTFFFLTVGAYGWYALKPCWRRYFVVSFLFVCGLAAKSMLVTVPFVLLLLDYWPLARFRASEADSVLHPEPVSPSWLILEKIPLLLLSGAASYITYIGQRDAGAVISTSRIPVSLRLGNAIHSYAAYVWKAFWPVHLANMYPYHKSALSVGNVAVAACFILAITILALRLRSRRYLLAGWLFFLGTLVPVIGLIQVGSQAMADRYCYVPLIGIFLMVVWGFADLADWKRQGWPELNGSIAAAVGVAVLLVLSFVTYRQAGYWKDSLTLWSHTLDLTPANYAAEDAFGEALTQAGKPDQAFPHFWNAASLTPYDPTSRTYLGAYYESKGQLAEAEHFYETIVQLKCEPRLCAWVYANLGMVYVDSADYTKGKQVFDHALQLNPAQVLAWNGMGEIDTKEGRFAEAAADFAHSAQLRPSAETYFQLAQALETAHRRSEALTAYQIALKFSPDSAAVKLRIADLSSRNP